MQPKILIVDDREPNLFLMETYLDKVNAELVCCYKPIEAAELVKKEEFSLCILDVQMPDLNGFELAEIIHKTKMNERTPIIFLTGVFSDSESIFKGYQKGAVDYLTKPIRREILVGKVKIFIELYMQRVELQKNQVLLEKYISKIKQAEIKRMKSIIESEDKERMRIANELHDGLGQYLSASSMNFNSIKEEVTVISDGIKEKFENGINFLHQAINESRTITSNLIPRIVEDFGLVESLEILARKLNETSDVRIKFIHKGFSKRLNKTIELNLYRLSQECLNNVIKHSNATLATLQIFNIDDIIHFTCEDDGIGFKIDKTLQDVVSYGLQSLYHRTKVLNGSIEIDSTENKGTVVSIDIPLKKI